MVASRIGSYELVERLDVGGMAEVFRARRRGVAGFERTVAIKRILPQIAQDPEIIDLFTQEAKLAVQLSHPNIARIYDLGRDGDEYFIAMEYVDGLSLRTLLRRLSPDGEHSETRGRLELATACFIAEEVADALEYAHFAVDRDGKPLHIVHRDISPSNIMISAEGHVKVIDFGLAKAANRISQTGHGIVKGKLAYLSPEQANGWPLDHRSDLFALGICLWEMLTGQRAFKRKRDRDTVNAVRRGLVRSPSEHVALPPELDQIVMKALCPDRDERYQTALSLKRALRKFRIHHNARCSQLELAKLVMPHLDARASRPPLPPLSGEPSELETDTQPTISLSWMSILAGN